MALTKLHHYNSSSASTSKPSLGFLSLTKFSSSKFNIGVAHFRFRSVRDHIITLYNFLIHGLFISFVLLKK